MGALAIPAVDLIIRSVVIYGALLFGLRLFGKREVGQLTIFDLVLVLLVSNAVQPAITGPDSSLLGGLIIMASLFAANVVVAALRLRSPKFRTLLAGHPTVIAQEGQWLEPALRREGLDHEDCMAALREHGLDNIQEVKLAVLELDGTISVVPTDQQVLKSHHRVRRDRVPQR
jgi:uncharacterized membrane protein YcaP (DUF421 family)